MSDSKLQISNASGEHSGHQSTQPALQENPDPAGSSWHGPCQRHPAYRQWDEPVVTMDGNYEAAFSVQISSALSDTFHSHGVIVRMIV